MRLNPLHILIVAMAFVIGVIVDHVFFAKPSTSSAKQPTMETAQAPLSTSPSDESQSVIADQTVSPPGSKSLDTILAERDRRQRTTDLEAFINSLRPADYAAALKRIRQMPGNNDRELASRLLVARWVQSDPNAALQFAASNRGFEYVADDVFEQAASTDLHGALERAKSLPSADLRYMALRGVLSFMADTNPAGALQLSQSLGDFPGQRTIEQRDLSSVGRERSAIGCARRGEGKCGWVALAGGTGCAHVGRAGSRGGGKFFTLVIGCLGAIALD